jgi:hypothetical protein
MKILVLGASYGSLLATKLLMAGHDVTLVCRPEEAALISAAGTVVRLRLKGDDAPRVIESKRLPGRLDAMLPGEAAPEGYDLVAMAMQEPQYRAPQVRELLARIAASGGPCLSIMNMPPLPYLRRIPGLDVGALEVCYGDPRVWDGLEPGKLALCSPDAQAFRPPDEGLNVLQVGLATNFKAATFADAADAALLRRLAADIEAVRLDGHEVPVKLKVHESVFVPLAKWAMLLTGNYRCVTEGAAKPIRAAVHDDLALSRQIYEWVAGVVRAIGAAPEDEVPFDRYAEAALSLGRPSSAARAIDAGAPDIERTDRLVQAVGRQVGGTHLAVDATVALVDRRLAANRAAVAGSVD